MATKTPEEVIAELKAAKDFKRYNKILFFKPYEKQQQHFDAGMWARERMLMAGNQLGKTEAGAVEMTYHLTGDYPPDWLGRRWERPIRAWAAGDGSVTVRDVQQKKLCGQPGVEDDFGTGFIPRSAFVDKPSLARGVTDAYDTIQVRHKSGGISTLSFKSYEQGRQKFQGEPVDFVWPDEEPPMDVYSEMLTRITATNGSLAMTFTPLKGMSDVVMRYLNEPSPDRHVTTMTIDDALHIPASERDRIIAGYPAHERDARARGVPMLGSGRIFQYSDEQVTEPSLDYLPSHWCKLWGTDFGIGHPFAAVLIAWDKDNDVIHVLHAIRMADARPLDHAQAMKPIGATVPVAWPHDGTQRQTDGRPLAQHYKSHGLLMLGSHATHKDGSTSTEAGIMEMDERFASRRLIIGAHLSNVMEEFRLYHREDGQIVKIRDDLLSALRVAVMMKRYAKPVQLGGQAPGRRPGQIAAGMDFDVFNGGDWE